MILHQPLWKWSTKGSIKRLYAEEHSPAHYEASLWPSPGVLCIHIITISWRAPLLANIPLSMVKCSVSMPRERPCGFTLCAHITLILGIKACAAARARRRTRVQQISARHWIVLDWSGGWSRQRKHSVLNDCLLWRLISEEPGEEVLSGCSWQSQATRRIRIHPRAALCVRRLCDDLKAIPVKESHFSGYHARATGSLLAAGLREPNFSRAIPF